MKKIMSLAIVLAIAGSSVLLAQEKKATDEKRNEDTRARVRAARDVAVQEKTATTPATPATPAAPARLDRERMMEMQTKQFETQLAQKKQQHQVVIDELKSVLKIAEDEKATKTVEALKALIAKKEGVMNEEVKAQEERMKMMQEQMKKRMEEMKSRQDQIRESSPVTKPATPATPTSAAKKAEAKKEVKKEEKK
jgi:hypothetical protein